MAYMSGGEYSAATDCRTKVIVCEIPCILVLGKIVSSKPWWTVEGMIDSFWALLNFCVLL